MMRSNIFVSTSAFAEKNLKKILSWCLDNGYSNVELGASIEFSEDNSEILFDFCAKKMNFLIHNYFPVPKEGFVLNLASGDAEIRAKSITLCKTAIDITSRLRAPFYSVHGGFAFDVAPAVLGGSLLGVKRIPYEKAYQNFLESSTELSDYAHKKNVKFLIENNVISEFNGVDIKDKYVIFIQAKELMEFYKDISSDNLFFLIDLGHLKVNSTLFGFDKQNFIREVAPHTAAFHINDNDGRNDSHLPFYGDPWFNQVIRENKDKVFIIEARKLSDSQLRQCYDTVAGLLN